ncbi:ParA family protein [Brevundimonas sp.]|uniref:ParA family protein n=1 Tax=Brevundimonas sp. TaxID=1871086 RepID=UPI002D290327|nr:ParA family protein [Brevundimonas sp.]HYD29226.1 ParA family protein [Brevundimonas sp.]
MPPRRKPTPLRAVAVMMQKGGAGKTTLAVHLAVAAGAAGERAVLIDADHPQASASVWGELRQDSEPPVITVEPINVAAVLAAAREDGRTLAIIDTSPHATPSAAEAANAADFILIPCQPSLFDLAAAERSAAIAKAAQAKAAGAGRRVGAAFVLNGVPAREDDPEVIDARAALEAILPVAPMAIGRRKPFVRAVAHGEAVTEFQRRGKAAGEISALLTWIKGALER